MWNELLENVTTALGQHLFIPAALGTTFVKRALELLDELRQRLLGILIELPVPLQSMALPQRARKALHCGGNVPV